MRAVHQDSQRSFDPQRPHDWHDSGMNDNRIDEGFSEEPSYHSGRLSPEPIEIDLPADLHSHIASVRDWLLAQPIGLRSEFASMILASLPTINQAPIVREAEARLRFDPIFYFPTEILLHVFQYIDVEGLLRACYVSKRWKLCAQEPVLWRRLFALEGWAYNRNTIRYLERTSTEQINKAWSNPRLKMLLDTRQANASMTNVDGKFLSQTTFDMADSRLWVVNGALMFPTPWILPTSLDGSANDDLRRRTVLHGDANALLELERTTAQLQEYGLISPTNFSRQRPEAAFCPLLNPTRTLVPENRRPSMNWQYLFQQRQRLEYNWNAGLFKEFRLPKEGFEYEQHKECVYTIQFSSKHVVSGSRDRTVRIWDLQTQTLKLPPLTGHGGSVLCLQFDESPDQDVMVSGGSDCDLIIWKFSTGEKIKHIKMAHTEPVLNVRFNDRYLVTCSKDNSIKVWNRQPLTIWDDAYPATNHSRDATYPEYIYNLAELSNNPNSHLIPTLEPYTQMMSLIGHSAAVNALSLHDNRFASASGDRKIILWDIPSGTIIRSFSGHVKGIACVQYDGRRIISGSSDKSVRIFDAETAAEVAILEGHFGLVRTVQADFGDIPGDEEELRARANAHGDRMVENKRKRLFGEMVTPQKEEEKYLVGAKLPPGAGGNRWAKIVSGSYDETVIIWRQDDQGKWVVAKTLKHEEAMDATSTNPLSKQVLLADTPEFRAQRVQATPRLGSSTIAQAERARILQTAQTWMAVPPRIPNGQNRSTLPFTSSAVSTQQRASSDPRHHSSSGSRQGPSPSFLGTSPPRAAPRPQLGSSPPSSRPPPPLQTLLNPHGRDSRPGPAVPNPTLRLSSASAAEAPSFSAASQPPQQQQHATQGQAQAHPTNTAMAPPQHHPEPEANLSRLFKLQFDARRIICCSSQPVIVGWDFANGDRDIIEASQFFGETV